jgi:hypothetical protein
MRHICCTCVAAVCTVAGAVTVFDFESADEVRRLAQRSVPNMTIGVTNVFASSGACSYRFKTEAWREGWDQWPLFILPVGAVTNWSGYDRLSVDLVNLAEAGDVLSVSVAGSGVGAFAGLRDQIALPARDAVQWIVPLTNWPAAMRASDVKTVGFTITRPAGSDVYLDNLTLLRPGEEPSVPKYSAASRTMLANVREQHADERAAKCVVLRRKLRSVLEEAGIRPAGFLVGQGSSMRHFRPLETFDCDTAAKFYLRLARNEYEALQLLVVPDGADLKDVSVSVGPLVKRRPWWQKLAKTATIPAADVAVEMVGYVKTVKSPTHYRLKDGEGGSVKTPVGWWPDPLLPFVKKADVKDGAVQSFWIRVRADESLDSGFYDGMVAITATVTGAGTSSLAVPFTVRVNDFTLPKTAVIPTAISFHPPIIHTYDKISEARKKDPKDITNIWKPHADAWTDFAADHLISIDYLYPAVRPRFDQLMRLKQQGRLGQFNLGYWRHSDTEGVTGSEQWEKNWFPKRDEDYAKAKALGILEHAYLYGADEIPKKDFPKVAIAAQRFKERYPGVPLLTTAYDPDFGTKGSLLGMIDAFCPLTEMYDPVKAEAARKAGHKVWWYVSNLPLTDWANLFVEKQPIETRLLMGAMTEKMKPDGFLFYAICSWGGNRKPIESGPYTDWDPVSFEDYHGCGSWIYCGPDGVPVGTIRLENYRDGLEDLAYAKILAEKGGKVDVPEDVMKSMTDYTLDPAPLQRWRDALADEIEARSPCNALPSETAAAKRLSDYSRTKLVDGVK